MANDRIVQIGAVGMRGPTVLGEPRIDTLVDPGTPIPAASTRIHRITGSDVAGSPRLPERLESLDACRALDAPHRRRRRYAPTGWIELGSGAEERT